MTTNKLLCITIEPELKRLKSIFCKNNIYHWIQLTPPTSTDESCFCIYKVYVKETDLVIARELLSETGYTVWVGK